MHAAVEPPVDDALPSLLVVDDLESNLKLMQVLLRGSKCNVVCAKSGAEALERLSQREFAVMLLDVEMPDLDGFEVARRAREKLAIRDMPILFVTGMQDTERGMLRGYGSGAVDFLFKPIDGHVLLSKLRVFLELHDGRKRLKDANDDLRRLADANGALAERFRAQHAELETAHEELRTAQAHMVQSAKMASLGQLVAGIAHEINNPLAFTSNHLHTVRRKLDSLRPRGEMDAPAAAEWSKVENRLQEMGIGLDRIKELVLKLRTFSRLDEGETKRVSVREGLDAILTIFQHRIKSGVEVRVDLAEQDELECSPSLFNQAVSNLISNSLDAMHDLGTLTIQTSRTEDCYSIVVSDSGPGIPGDLRQRVLEPFFTTKSIGEGTGLGLSIAYGVVRKHGGTIDIDDAEGGGARVTIRLPMTGSSERPQCPQH
ncbi:MAG TPA: ATP-binding protein [Polyangiaceae bacterium]|jgi:two-component system NtrC family sensor kinase|nr:ATP-binding protein [Polyangiaceae bacterium]